MSGGQVVRDRTRALLLLAGARYDVYAPGPKNSRTFAHGKAAPTKKEPCELCDGDKVTRDKFGRESTCESCKGRGWHPRDPMLNQDRQGATDWQAQARATAGTRRVLCDSCGGHGVENPAATESVRCRYCDGAGKVSVPIERVVLNDSDREVDVVLNEWERMLVAREGDGTRPASGSFAEYDKCVAELARRSPHRLRVFREVYEIKVKSEGFLSETEGRLLSQAVADLLAWMPEVILVPREIVQADERQSKQPHGRGSRPADRAARDAEIIRRFKAKEPVREIASWAGLSVGRVNEIVYAEREVA